MRRSGGISGGGLECSSPVLKEEKGRRLRRPFWFLFEEMAVIVCPLLFEVLEFGFLLGRLHRGADGICGVDIAFRLQHLVMDEGLHGSVLLLHFHSIIFQDLKQLNWNSITSTSFVRSDKAHLTSHSRMSGPS